MIYLILYKKNSNHSDEFSDPKHQYYGVYLDRNVLNVVDEGTYDERNIKFTITSPPSYGVIRKVSESNNSSFTKHDIIFHWGWNTKLLGLKYWNLS